MRHVAIITGTRAEYGILKPLIEHIEASDSLQGHLLVGGMHLAPEFGSTINQILADGFRIDARIDMLFSSDARAAMGKGLGIGIYGFTQEIERLAPDIVMVLGDRVEMFAGAAAGLCCGATIAHIHGGEVTQGGLDEYMRHAITKLSHLHFAATEKSKERIIRLGENPEFVFCVGTPGLDAILQFPQLSDAELSQRLMIPIPERFLLLVQHPISTHPQTAADEMRETLSALKEFSIPVFLFYPNSDAGSREMLAVIREYETEEWIHTFVNVSRDIYCNLLRRATALIGNTSSGIIDAPAYGAPVVNIGERQKGRERGENVIDAQPQRESIKQAVHTALFDEAFRQRARTTRNPYGDGRASERIGRILESVDLEKAWREKRLPW
ncbi:MAG: UDP-N-acetylglucosamine 2-epimerase (hydrolyzing) [Candidatus Omnitrophota bacterium]|jgi:UDP-N-acetylglucosamine 2-epimerase (non-hydrolysing)/GDP/UDP-N,N'-diacetylbacillosamine 2-epimerase (hydrolysing)|nr:MAG: UDP-N-acetylglucosamine 2-epimerase (hydrolyzing) [Candidatus Omnitrophota bacterium]